MKKEIVVPIEYKLKSYKSVYTTKAFKDDDELIKGLKKKYSDFEFIRYTYGLNFCDPDQNFVLIIKDKVRSGVDLTDAEIDKIISSLGLSHLSFSTNKGKNIIAVTFKCKDKLVHKKVVGNYDDILESAVKLRNETAKELLKLKLWRPFGMKDNKKTTCENPRPDNKSGIVGVNYSQNGWTGAAVNNLSDTVSKHFKVSKTRTLRECFDLAVKHRMEFETELFGKTNIDLSKLDEYYIKAMKGYNLIP